MEYQDRGKIVNEKRKQQINDFSNLLYGKITPTDIDGLIEYKNKLYILFEIKYKDTELPRGQKLALQRLVVDLSLAKKAICFIANHEIHNTNKHINVSECNIREMFYKNKWIKVNKNITLKRCIDLFIKKFS